ncbi:MAG: preprotein translocase subunit SecY [Acidimicrobiia bacterium]
MFSRLRNMFRVPDLRNKILFTVAVIAIYRLGTHIPLPYVKFSEITRLQELAEKQTGGIAAYINLFSGGLTKASIFSLGIMPYITASIIMQLLGVVIPKLEEWREEGQTGQKKITQWTRYVTVGLAVVQSTALAVALESGNSAFLGGQLPQGTKLIPNAGTARYALIVVTLTAGTALIMWLGELITQRGIGNGMSLIIFASVASGIPGVAYQVRKDESVLVGISILLLVVAMIAAIVFVESGQRRIPVQFAKRIVGRKQLGGQSTYIPLKVNQAGVIPVIFASAILQFPSIIAQATPWDGFKKWVNDNLLNGTGWTYITLFALLIFFFSYFYTAIAFNPEQQADIIKKQGGFIPGIRPGRPTEQYLKKVLNRITLPGAIFLTIIALVPLIAFSLWDIKALAGFGGTSLLIIVGVGLETMKQIDSQLMNRNYEGFLAS